MAIVISSASTMQQLLRCINKRGDSSVKFCGKIFWRQEQHNISVPTWEFL